MHRRISLTILCSFPIGVILVIVFTDRPFGGDVKSGKIEKIDVKTGGHVSSNFSSSCFSRQELKRLDASVSFCLECGY